MQNVEGKTAFITGGASGMGLGMAKVFSEAGMKVVIADVRQNALDEAMGFFKETNRAVHPIKLDVTNREDWARAADEAEKAFGKVHVLVNNAGVGVGGMMQDATWEDWDFCVGVNFGGVVNGVKTMLPRMLAHGEEGQIVCTASMAGLYVAGHAGIYCASKFAVVGLCEALRHDLAETKIGVSVYCPGPVATSLGQSTAETRPAHLAATGARRVRSQPVQQEGAPPPRPWAMDPVEVGKRILSGIRHNDIWIISHAEFGPGIAQRNEALLAAVPDEQISEDRKNSSFNFLWQNPMYDHKRKVKLED
jgi:NAD(P)-dependent dehydrogenase (short-subunit alcohol dehydrogenase family)